MVQRDLPLTPHPRTSRLSRGGNLADRGLPVNRSARSPLTSPINEAFPTHWFQAAAHERPRRRLKAVRHMCRYICILWYEQCHISRKGHYTERHEADSTPDQNYPVLTFFFLPFLSLVKSHCMFYCHITQHDVSHHRNRFNKNSHHVPLATDLRCSVFRSCSSAPSTHPVEAPFYFLQPLLTC